MTGKAVLLEQRLHVAREINSRRNFCVARQRQKNGSTQAPCKHDRWILHQIVANEFHSGNVTGC